MLPLLCILFQTRRKVHIKSKETLLKFIKFVIGGINIHEKQNSNHDSFTDRVHPLQHSKGYCIRETVFYKISSDSCAWTGAKRQYKSC